MKIKYHYSRIAIIGLWVLLLSATISNALDVLFVLLTGSVFPLVHDFIQYFTIGVIAIMLLSLYRRLWKLIISTIILFSAIWYFSYVYNQDAAPFIKDNYTVFFFETLPYLWVFHYFVQIDVLKKDNQFFSLLYNICRVKLIIALFSQLIMFIVPSTDIFHDYMNATNAMLLGFLVITARNLFVHHRNKIDTILELSTLFAIIILGSRGGLLCYGSLYILYYLFIADIQYKAFVSLLFIPLVILLYHYGPSIMYSLLNSGNRYVDLLSSNSLIVDESRTLIAGIIFSSIMSHPWGMGVMADRAILTSSNEIWSVFYSHNIELELGVNFGLAGLFLGALLLLVIIYYANRPISNDIKLPFLALVSCSFVKLQVSSSFWLDPIFWAMIGVVIIMMNYNKTLIRRQK